MKQLHKTHGVHNFVELHQAWAKTLDTQETQQNDSSKKLPTGIFWAVDRVTFPADIEKRWGDSQRHKRYSLDHTADFCVVYQRKKDWFKTRSLIKKQIDKNPKTIPTPWKTPITKRFFKTFSLPHSIQRWSPITAKFRHRAKQSGGRESALHGAFSLPIWAVFSSTPKESTWFFSRRFLFSMAVCFECLDKPDKDKPKKILRVDGFSDRNDNPLHVPNETLLFGRAKMLTSIRLTAQKASGIRCAGWLIFSTVYKFTVVEKHAYWRGSRAWPRNSSAKSLKIFWLRTIPKRRQLPASRPVLFTRPAKIVNYMTDESLIAYFKICPSFHLTNLKVPCPQTPPPSQLDLIGQAAPVQNSTWYTKKSPLSDEQKRLNRK